MPISVKHSPSAVTLASQVAGAYELERAERDLRANEQKQAEAARLQAQMAMAAMAEAGRNARHQASLQADAAQQQGLNAYRQGSLALQGQAQQQRAYEGERNFQYQHALNVAQMRQQEQSLMDNRLRAAGEAVRTGRAHYTDAQKNKLTSLERVIGGEGNSKYTPRQNQEHRETAIAMRNQIYANPQILSPDQRMSVQEKVERNTFMMSAKDAEGNIVSDDYFLMTMDADGAARMIRHVPAPDTDSRDKQLMSDLKEYDRFVQILNECRLSSENTPEALKGIQALEMIVGEYGRRLEAQGGNLGPPEGERFGQGVIRRFKKGAAAQGGLGAPPPVMNAQQSLESANYNAHGSTVAQPISVSNEEIMSGNLRPGTVYRGEDKEGVERLFVISQLEAGHGSLVFVRLNPETGMWEEIYDVAFGEDPFTDAPE